jgi:hypothetical protein
MTATPPIWTRTTPQTASNASSPSDPEIWPCQEGLCRERRYLPFARNRISSLEPPVVGRKFGFDADAYAEDLEKKKIDVSDESRAWHLGVSEYTMGRKSRREKNKACWSYGSTSGKAAVSIKLAQSIANRKTVIPDDPLSASCRKCSVSRLMIKRRGSRHIRHRNRVTAVIVKVIRDDFYIERRKWFEEDGHDSTYADRKSYTKRWIIDWRDKYEYRTSKNFYRCQKAWKILIRSPPVVKSSTVLKSSWSADSILIKDMPTSIDLDLVNEFFHKSFWLQERVSIDLHAGNVGFKDDRFVITMGSVNVTDSEMQDLWQVLVSSTEHVFSTIERSSTGAVRLLCCVEDQHPNELKLIKLYHRLFERWNKRIDMMNTFKVIRGVYHNKYVDLENTSKA